MGKAVHPDVLDGALGVLRQATRMVVLPLQPGNLAAVDANRLAEAPLAAGDFTVAAGTAGGRRVTVAGKSGLGVLASGAASHVALTDAARLLYVTTCPAQSVVSGATLSVAAWDVEVGEPA